MFDVDESVVELEECVGSGVGNAWSFSVCGVVTVFGVCCRRVHGGTRRVYGWCCGIDIVGNV